jgi:Ca2+-binding RTX toxin-like protein
VEQLEGRHMMAVVASFTDNQLSIVGDSAADTVVVSTVDVGGVAQVTVNGQSVGAGVDASAVTSIFANLGGGNDTMNLSTLDLAKFSGLTDGSIEIRGGAGNDTLVGSPLGDILKGEDGNDSLTGGAGNDQLIGGNGNDTLIGGAGDDTLDGGAGDDMYSFSGSTDLGSDTVVQAASGNLDTLGFGSLGGAIVVDISMTTPQVVRAGQLTLTLSDGAGIDNVQGTAYDDVILGNAGGNSLMGNGGNDYLWGRGGNDWLDGGSGNDTLYGGDGDDTLLGKGGNDSLYGHAGDDTLNGNEGNDYLSGDDGNDTYIVANYGTKTIGAASGSDRIDVSGQTLTGPLDLSSTSAQTIAASLSVRFTEANAVAWILGGAKNHNTSAGAFTAGFYTVPGELGTTTLIEFKYGGAVAAYDNDLFVFDATDPINRYAARPISDYLFTGNVTPQGATKQLAFRAGSKVGFFLEQDGSPGTLFFSEDARNDNDIASDSDRNHVGAADLGGGRVQLSWEDLNYVLPNPDDYIFDGDFNDLFISVGVLALGVNHSPDITSDGGGLAAAIQVPENHAAVTTVTATDPEVPGQVLTYSITGGADGALFSIVPQTGVLTFLAAPDFENPTDGGGDNVYDVQVTVTDSGDPNLSDTQDIAISVTDVNEAPIISSDGGGDTAAIQVPENHAAVTTVTATDPEVPGQVLTYSITGGADGALFSIVPQTGVLTFLAAPDFENPTDGGGDNVYDVQVTVTDSITPALSDTQHISVVVANVNEAPVVNSVPDQQSKEGATVSQQINATDPEGGALSYAAVNLPVGLLIDANTGVITGKIAFTAAGVFAVTVTVTDSGAPTESTDLVFQWTVDDAFIDFLTGREWVAGAPTLNSVRSVDMTYPELFVSPTNEVGLVVGNSENLPPDLSDVLFSVVGGPSGTFATPPTITPSPAATIQVVVGIDINQNAVLDAAEQTHSIAIGRQTLGLVSFTSQRTVGPNAEEVAFEIRPGDYFEVDGTFEFTMTPGPGSNLGPMAAIRYDIVDYDAALYNPLQGGAGLSFTYTFNGADDQGNVYIRLYVDANRNGMYDAGEDHVDSTAFFVDEAKVWEFSIWYPDTIDDPSAIIAGFLELGEQYVMGRDAEGDYRGLVDFRLSGNAAYAYPLGGVIPGLDYPTPGYLISQEDVEDMFTAAPDWTIIVVEDIHLEPDRPYGVAEDLGLVGADEIIYNWALRGDETLAHEIGHLAGLVHHGPSDRLMENGPDRTRPAKMLTFDDARAYTEGAL